MSNLRLNGQPHRFRGGIRRSWDRGEGSIRGLEIAIAKNSGRIVELCSLQEENVHAAGTWLNTEVG